MAPEAVNRKSVHFVQNLNGNALATCAVCTKTLPAIYNMQPCTLSLIDQSLTLSLGFQSIICPKSNLPSPPFFSLCLLFLPHIVSVSAKFCAALLCVFASQWLHAPWLVQHIVQCVHTFICAAHSHNFQSSFLQPIPPSSLLCFVLSFFPSLSLLLNLLFPDLCTGACSPIICFLWCQLPTDWSAQPPNLSKVLNKKLDNSLNFEFGILS